MKRVLILASLLLGPAAAFASSAPPHFFNDGMTLYNAGRYSEAMDAFDNAVPGEDVTIALYPVSLHRNEVDVFKNNGW